MNDFIELLKFFQSKYPDLVQRMKQCDHHFNSQNLNPFHGDGDIWTHTMLCYNAFLHDYEIPTTKLVFQKQLAIIVLCHDIGKIYTRHIPNGQFGKVAFYGHGESSVQHTVDLIESFGWTFTTQEIYEILCVVCHHLDFYQMTQETRNSLLNGNFKLQTLFYKMFEYDTIGSISTEKSYNVPIEFNIKKQKELNPQIIIFSGCPATGKDYYAKTLYPDHTLLSLDEIRIEYYCQSTDHIPSNEKELYEAAYRYCSENKINLMPELFRQIDEAIEAGDKGVCICNTNLTKKMRRSLMSGLSNYVVRMVYVVSPTNLLFKRDVERSDKTVGKMVLNRFMYSQNVPTFDEGYNSIELIFNNIEGVK